MNQKEIRELIEFLVEKDITEFELERGDMKLHVKRAGATQPAPVVQVAPALAPMPAMAVPVAPVSAPSPAPVAPSGEAAAQAPAAPGAEAAEAGLFIVKSPI